MVACACALKPALHLLVLHTLYCSEYFSAACPCHSIDKARWLRNWWQMADDILHLHGIAQQLRGRRYAEGSLRLDNVKISFELDGEGNPVSSFAYVQRCAEPASLRQSFKPPS